MDFDTTRESAQLADETERAQLSADQFTQDALARHRHAQRSQTGDWMFCGRCGDRLSRERKAASPGCRHCAECQTAIEREVAAKARLFIR